MRKSIVYVVLLCAFVQTSCAQNNSQNNQSEDISQNNLKQ